MQGTWLYSSFSIDKGQVQVCVLYNVKGSICSEHCNLDTRTGDLPWDSQSCYGRIKMSMDVTIVLWLTKIRWKFVCLEREWNGGAMFK